MDYRIIKAPTDGTCDILQRRIDINAKIRVKDYEAIGLIQGKICDMVFATDIAEKASGVRVLDIRGNCPQNMIMIAIFGDTMSVEMALVQVKEKLAEQTRLFSEG